MGHIPMNEWKVQVVYGREHTPSGEVGHVHMFPTVGEAEQWAKEFLDVPYEIVVGE